MDISTSLKPVNEKNSIKEAVISLFLVQSIIKPESFQELINKFDQKFQSYKNISTLKIGFETLSDGDFVRNEQEEKVISGFQFIGFDNGILNQVLKGQNSNEGQTANKASISYHLLKYERWNPFISNFYSYIKTINDFRQGLFINAFGLQYIDDFNWIGQEKIPLDEIFNTDTEIIPKKFFNGENNLFVLVNNGDGYFDRIEIRTEPKPISLPDGIDIPSIRIIHNIIQPLSELVSIKDFLKQTDYRKKFDEIHDKNKEVLKNILKKEITELINLN